MTRWQANAVIVFVALIWGTTFVVQQTGMENIGPQYFTGVRFLLGTLVVLPFALRDLRKIKRGLMCLDWWPRAFRCIWPAFCSKSASFRHR